MYESNKWGRSLASSPSRIDRRRRRPKRPWQRYQTTTDQNPTTSETSKTTSMHTNITTTTTSGPYCRTDGNPHFNQLCLCQVCWGGGGAAEEDEKPTPKKIGFKFQHFHKAHPSCILSPFLFLHLPSTPQKTSHIISTPSPTRSRNRT